MNPQTVALSPRDERCERLADQAHQFLQMELANGAQLPGERDNLLVARCAAHLMAACRCSQYSAETHAAQAVAELACRHSTVRFDMDRSTTYALFVQDGFGLTRVISAETINRLLATDLLLVSAKRVTH